MGGWEGVHSAGWCDSVNWLLGGALGSSGPLGCPSLLCAILSSSASPWCSAKRHKSVLREIVLEQLQHLLPVQLSGSNNGLLVVDGGDLRRLFDVMQAQGTAFDLPTMQHCLVDPASL